MKIVNIEDINPIQYIVNTQKQILFHTDLTGTSQFSIFFHRKK